MEVPGFFFVICPDAHIAVAYAMEQCSFWKIEHAAKHTFWGDEWPDKKFFYELSVRDLTGSKKVLFLRHAEQFNAASWKDLSEKMKTPRPGVTVFFFLEGEWPKGRPSVPVPLSKLGCWELARKKKWFCEHAGLSTPRARRDYVLKQAAETGLRIQGSIADEIARSVQPDAGAISNIVSQLKLLSDSGREITAEDLNHLADYVPEIKLFDLLSNVQHGNVEMVWKAISHEEDGGEELLFPFLGTAVADARALWKYLSHESPSFSRFNDTAFKENLARRLGFEGIGRIFKLAGAVDQAVKSGSATPLGGFERFVSGLSEICAARGRHAG